MMTSAVKCSKKEEFWNECAQKTAVKIHERNM